MNQPGRCKACGHCKPWGRVPLISVFQDKQCALNLGFETGILINKPPIWRGCPIQIIANFFLNGLSVSDRTYLLRFCTCFAFVGLGSFVCTYLGSPFLVVFVRCHPTVHPPPLPPRQTGKGKCGCAHTQRSASACIQIGGVIDQESTLCLIHPFLCQTYMAVKNNVSKLHDPGCPFTMPVIAA